MPSQPAAIILRSVLSGLLLVGAGAAAAAPPEAERLFGVWTPANRAEASVPTLPLTARAQEALQGREQPEAAAIPCEPVGMPAMLETAQPIELIDRGHQVLMRFAEWGAERTIHTDPRNGPAMQEHSPLGVSFGRWEGKTLAVFTTYISHSHFDLRGTPQTRDVTVLERYTASDDGTRLDFHVTVTDPATFTAPVTREGHMTRETTAPFEPRQECSEPL